MYWTWDEDKNSENIRKHRISFETAMLAFQDELAVTEDDPYPDERRFQTTGMVGMAVLIVIHTLPEHDPGFEARGWQDNKRSKGHVPVRGGSMRVKVSDLTPSQRAELEALVDLSDDEIDTDDIPENPRVEKSQARPLRRVSEQKGRTKA